MDKHPIIDLMETTMAKIREMTDVNTIIGQPIQAADNTTLIPVSRVTFGFASGGSDIHTAKAAQTEKTPFGGGSGAGVKIEPVAFLVVKDGNVRILNVNPASTDAVGRIVDTAPEILDNISDMINKKKTKE